MRRAPYSEFRGQKLTLNDYLAIDRTMLANERTLLAYGRTALALAVVGGSGMKFFTATWIQAVGALFILAGVLVAARGWQRYAYTKKLLAAALERQTGAAEHPLQEEVRPSPEEAAKTAESGADPRPR